MALVDVHMILLGRERVEWMDKAIGSLKNEPINFFFVDGTEDGTHIGMSRYRGFKLGEAPFVTYVDPDDWIEPGIFDKLLQSYHSSLDAVYSRDMLVDEEGNEGSVRRASPGHMMLYKRERIQWDRLKASPAGSEVWMKREKNSIQLEDVGYYYRLYEASPARQAHKYVQVVRDNHLTKDRTT